MLNREGERFLRQDLDVVGMSTKLVQRRRIANQGVSQAEGMGKTSGQCEHVVRPRLRLVDRACQSQRMSQVAHTAHRRIMPVHEGVGAVGLDVVKCEPLLPCCPRCGELSPMKRCNPHGPVRFDQQILTLRIYGKLHQVISDLACRFELAPNAIRAPQSVQRREKVSRISELSAQCDSSGIHRFDLWMGIAFQCGLGHAMRDLQRQFAPKTFRRIGECLEDNQSVGEVTNRLGIGRKPHGLLSSQDAISERLLCETGFLEVPRQLSGHTRHFGGLRVMQLLQRVPDILMDRRPRGLVKRRIKIALKEVVAKAVARQAGGSQTLDLLGLHQPLVAISTTAQPHDQRMGIDPKNRGDHFRSERFSLDASYGQRVP